MPSAWTYGFFENPAHPRPEHELTGLAGIHESRDAGEMVELRLPDRRDPPGKRARPGDLVLFFVRGEEGIRLRGRAVVGGEVRRGAPKPWMAALYGSGETERHWLPLSRLELHPSLPTASLSLREDDLPGATGQAFVKRLRATDHLDQNLLRWWRGASAAPPV